MNKLQLLVEALNMQIIARFPDVSDNALLRLATRPEKKS